MQVELNRYFSYDINRKAETEREESTICARSFYTGKWQGYSWFY